ncbi:MAG: triose-phosphate isomerase, partial [Arenimonas sp.]|nr:triose-phosphate isomerase [Arenimonas sp.]
MRKKLVAGNWKLNGDRVFARGLLDAIAQAPRPDGVEVVILPPAPYLAELSDRYGSQGLQFGAQDLGVNDLGAYTGEISGRMLRDVGARYV